MSADAMVEKLALELPSPFPPAGVYVNAVRMGNLLVLGGHVPISTDQQVVLGKLGDDLDVDAGRGAARLAALSALTTLRAELGSLDRVAQIVSLRGVVNATPEFTGHTQVIDGASEIFVQVFGKPGRHARLAVGVSSLPANLALEIELLVEIGNGA
jgi:enamine deaminase RidA (YjgF/YER057c/UK114 family)